MAIRREDLQNLAITYARQGWRVFPCVVGGKTPRTRSGFKAGTDNTDQLRTWWAREAYNIGIWTGASNLVVLDLDLKVPTKLWRASEWDDYREVQDHDTPVSSGLATWLDVLASRELDWIRTYTVRTPSSGVHLYFSYEGNDIHPAVGWRPFIDIRAAGSYVVAPPSVTEKGRYEQDLDMPGRPEPLPSWLRELLVEETRPASGDAGNEPPEGSLRAHSKALLAKKSLET